MTGLFTCLQNSIGELVYMHKNVICQVKLDLNYSTRSYPPVPLQQPRKGNSLVELYKSKPWRYVTTDYHNFDKKLWILLDVFEENFNEANGVNTIQYALLYSSCRKYEVKITISNVTLL